MTDQNFSIRPIRSYHNTAGSSRRSFSCIVRCGIGRSLAGLMTILFVLGVAGAARADYSYRKSITVNHTKVSGSAALSSFPMLVSISGDADLKTTGNGGHVQNSLGYDIVFKTSGGTTLSHDVEQYDGATGKLIAWVKVPTLQYGADTVIYMHYGDSSITTPTENPTAVWDSEYRGVWHLEENPTGSAPQMKDSTAYGNHGTTEGATSDNPWNSSDRVSGKIGYATYFNDFGTSKKTIRVSDDNSLDVTTAVTMQAWVKPDVIAELDMPAIYKDDAYKIESMRTFQNAPTTYAWNTDSASVNAKAGSPLSAGVWSFLAATYDSATGVIRLYINGVEVASKSTSNSPSTIHVDTTPLFIGCRSGTNQTIEHQAIDEARVTAVVRSAGWIATEYNNQNSPATFYTISTEQGLATDYTITASAGANGSISPSGPVTVSAGGSQAFSITPDGSYEILDVKVDGASVGAVSSHSFTGVSADHTITASFTLPGSHIITTVAGANGSISPAGPVSVASGGNQSFTIIPQPGYGVEDVLVDSVSVGAVGTYTFPNVTADHTIEAHFVQTEPPPPLDECVDIADVPLDAQFVSAPPNIMLLMDDSGSMSFEILVPDYPQGKYMDSGYYVFDNPGGSLFGEFDFCPGCHVYDYDGQYILKRGGTRLHWKTQWSDYNKVYYDPNLDYQPWPSTTGTLGAADPDQPLAHPLYDPATSSDGYRFDLSGSFDTIGITAGEVIADNQNDAVFTRTGPWQGFSPYAEAYNDHYYAAREVGSYTATWSPYLSAGQYDVYARWRSYSDRSEHVIYSISHSAGTTPVEVNQKNDGSAWVSLGTFTFNDGVAQVSVTADLSAADDQTVCADAIKFVPTGSLTLDIKRAHYYAWSATENKPYLVIVDGGAIGYYEFNDADADDVVDAGELLPTVSPPADVRTERDYTDERQNFANWYQYYRQRGRVAIFGVADVLFTMQGIRLGIYGLNAAEDCRPAFAPSVVQPVLNLKVNGEDHMAELLDTLYHFYWTCNTPLRRAFEQLGRYFDKHDNQKINRTTGDDSPWATAAEGGECQQAYALLVTDGYYDVGDPRNASIANADGDNGAPYADAYSNTMADIAMYYYERDLNTDLGNFLIPNEVDAATHQHMVTYTVGFGVYGTLDPDNYCNDNTDENYLRQDPTCSNGSAAYIGWTDPSLDEDWAVERVDDVWHAAVNGRGEFLNATSSEELIVSLEHVIHQIQLRIFSSAGLSINGDRFYEELHPDILMYQPSYNSDGWTGNVKAYRLDEVTGEVITIPYAWSASEQLQSNPLPSATRLIATHDGSAGIPFRFDSLNTLQKSQLDPDWGTDDTNARNMVNYLRGDTTNEVQYGGTFRNRFFLLGDIVHSSPTYKDGMIYAGANDGMLHAFNADSGEELFAYVPNLVFENLKYLSDPDYSHRFFVDLTPTANDVDLASGVTTMLVGGLGKGGRGYYALDLSNVSTSGVVFPDSENDVAAMVMWEYPDAATPDGELADLGFSFSLPVVVQSHSSSAPWIVIFGNGYNSSTGRAVLYILDAASGTLLRKIDTQIGDCNGLSSPTAVDVNYDHKVDYVYAGDLKGNLWKFDLTDSDESYWGAAYKDGATPKPLFQTVGKPITTKPAVMYHCSKHGYMVVFGSGRYLGETDISNNSDQALYGIWDYGDDADDSEWVGVLDGLFLSNTNLLGSPVVLPQPIDTGVDADGGNYRTLSDSILTWTTTSMNGADECGDYGTTEACDPNEVGENQNPDPVADVGWYVDLPENGERVVSDVLIRDGKVIAVSFTPAGSMCGASGTSWLMMFDACSGSRPSTPHIDINGDNAINEQDLINIGTDADPIWVAPIGKQFDEKKELPSFITLPGQAKAKMIVDTKDGGSLTIKDTKQGMVYWRLFRQ
jgi:type IV pilus assembly protein PilY1